jgi:hypothetical protein
MMDYQDDYVAGAISNSFLPHEFIDQNAFPLFNVAAVECTIELEKRRKEQNRIAQQQHRERTPPDTDNESF